MMGEDIQLVKLLETRVRQLILRNEELVQQQQQLGLQLAEYNHQIDTLREENNQLKAQYTDLKTARMLQLSDDDTRSARQRIARLIREIDKCIVILRAER